MALLIVLIDAVARAMRLRLLMPVRGPLSLGRYIVINAYGEAASAATPGRLGGEPARFVAFRRAGIATAPAATALASERVIDLSSIAAVGVVLGALFGQRSIGALLRSVRQVSPEVLAVSLAALILLLIAGWLGLRRYRSRLGPESTPGFGPRVPLAPPRALVAATALGAVSIALRVAILPVLCLSLPIAVEWGPAILGAFALLYGQLVLPTPAGLGGVEAGFALGFAGHLTPGAIAGLLLTWRVYTLGIGAAVGVAFALRGALTAWRRAVRVVPLGIALLGAAASTSSAQSMPLGSRNLAVGHWSYDAIRQLRTRGYLSNLNATVQPYRRLEVARGLVGLSPDTLTQPVAHWVRLLREELRPELRRLAEGTDWSWGVQFAGGVRASTGERLVALRETGSGDAWPWYRAGGWAEAGPLAAETRLLGDLFLEDDPDGRPPGQRRYGRADNAYLSATFPLGNVTLGRLQRNWSVQHADGLLLSDVATAYPQLALELTVGRFALRSLTGELDTLEGLKRYVAGHRLDYQSSDLVLSFGETIVYATEHGVALRFLNPLEFLFFDHENAPNDLTMNLALNWQVWWRPGPVTVSGELMLDDLDVIPGERDPEPTLYALRLGVEETELVPQVDVAVEYQRVAAFVYRTPNSVDSYTFLERGLATNFSDYDLLTASVDVHPPFAGLRITPVVQVLRQGEGDFRDPVPPTAEYLASPSIFLGTRERTIRLALRGRYQPLRYVWVGFDVGRNFVDNADHVEGAERSEFAGTAALGVTFDLPRR
jgi:uncharacterized membrane protein YbhN (UPF0104 family)